jgi:hypothetical protein
MMLAVATGLLAGAGPEDRFQRSRVPPNLLVPLPRSGGIPPMAPAFRRPGTAADWERHDAAFAALRSRALSAGASSAARAAGLEELRAVRDPAAFESMYAAVRGKGDDAMLAVLDAYARGGEAGQHALASVAIAEDSETFRAEATRRIATPVCAPVLAAIDEGLRGRDHDRIDRAGILAGAVHAVESIPALIFAQVATGSTSGGAGRPSSTSGDRAWIAIGTTTSYVQNVVPVVGDNSGAFQPVIGQLIEGVVLRVQDCAVTIYHGGVHDSLVAMSSYDSGTDTSVLGWDMAAWARWFDGTYVPLKQAQDRQLAAAAQAAGAAVQPGATAASPPR